MMRKLLCCLAAIAMGAATPAMAFHGGGGFGGMHAGFGGMHAGGFGGMHAGGFHGGMIGGHPGFAPMGQRFVGGRFGFAHNRFAFFHHRHFHNAAFFGVPFVAYGGSYYDDDYCWRRVWTYYGWRWAYTCGY